MAATEVEETYTDRYVDHWIVTRVEGNSVTGDSDYTTWFPDEAIKLIKVGCTVDLEMKGGPFGLVTGRGVEGVWIQRQSDQQIGQERLERQAKRDAERRTRLETYREEWQAREDALPEWIKVRIRHFHERGGQNFELEGWAYELAVCELAVLYDADPKFGPRETYTYKDESQAIDEYAEKEGTSGNQHDMARALVRAHREGEPLGGTVSALSPITGNAYYEKKY